MQTQEGDHPAGAVMVAEEADEDEDRLEDEEAAEDSSTARDSKAVSPR
jgi:hypothetical protein